MFKTAHSYLKHSEQEINNLNVFPVPDGDTGTNMLLTVNSVMDSLKSETPDNLQELGEIFTKSALLGARGNSGVILSQIIKGFCLPWDNLDKISPRNIIECFEKATEIAYRAVKKPVEGTILTVLKDTSHALKKNRRSRNLAIDKVFEIAMEESEKSLQKTPELLDILKEAGVVDAGGYGLVVLLRGFYAGYKGEEITLPREESIAEFTGRKRDFKYTYCTELLVDGQFVDKDLAENFLSTIGDSILLITDKNITKIHVHTNDPSDVLGYFQKFGHLFDIKINNMKKQAREKAKSTEQKTQKEKEFSVVSVAQGLGLSKVFKSLGSEMVVNGGQTMNPSAEAILDAINAVNSDNIIVLPNNKNVILAAEQAANLSQKNVIVVPSQTIQQGLQALLSYNPSVNLETNVQNLINSTKDVISVNITKAIKNSTVSGKKIKKGDYIALVDGEIKYSGNNLLKTTVQSLKKPDIEEASFVTVFFGNNLEKEIRSDIQEILTDKFSKIEFDFQDGEQPDYELLIAIEK